MTKKSYKTRKNTNLSNENLASSTQIKSIKIIGGIFKGKILYAGILPTTRPTKAIVKESLFNTLQQDIYNKTFLEVFAGYGSVGFEAFSRGAKSVLFIEKDKQIFDILQKNILSFNNATSKHTDVTKCHTQNKKIITDSLVAYNEDSLIFLPLLVKKANIDIFYVDPPFKKQYYEDCFRILNNIDLLGKMVIFEHISSAIMPQYIANISLLKTRKFGLSSISYYC